MEGQMNKLSLLQSVSSTEFNDPEWLPTLQTNLLLGTQQRPTANLFAISAIDGVSVKLWDKNPLQHQSQLESLQWDIDPHREPLGGTNS